jgi:hypothetical protein
MIDTRKYVEDKIVLSYVSNGIIFHWIIVIKLEILNFLSLN